MEIPDKQFVFIIGAPRSGTTWLQALIAAHPCVVSTIDELKLFDFITSPLEDGWRALLDLRQHTGGDRLGLSAMWTDEEFYSFLKDIVAKVFRQVAAERPDATILLDKAPGYSDLVEHIDRLVPGPRFIHMVRDGRDVAASLMAASRGWGRPWAPAEVEKAGRRWKEHVLAARKAGRFGDRYLEIRYEDLLKRGPAVLGEVFSFIGEPLPQETISEIYEAHTFEKMKKAGKGTRGLSLPTRFFRKGRAGGWRDSLDHRERFLLDRAAGDLLRALGYADDSWWYDRAHQRFTVPLAIALSSRRNLKSAIRTAWNRTIRARSKNRRRSARLDQSVGRPATERR